MSTYNTLFDGKHFTDFFEAEGGYNYYCYVGTNGTWAIMREKTDETEYRFAIGNSKQQTATAAISARATLTYVRPDGFGFSTF